MNTPQPDGRLVDQFGRYMESRVPRQTRTLVRADELLNNVQVSTIDVDAAHQILAGARGGDTSQLFSLYQELILSDSHLQTELAKRKLAVLRHEPLIAPRDENNRDDKRAAFLLSEMLEDLPCLFDALNALLDSCLYPVAVVEKVFALSHDAAAPYRLASLRPVPPQLLDYREGLGLLRIRDVDDMGNIQYTTHYADPMRYVIHRSHLLNLPDQMGGPMRSLVFWCLFSGYDRDWWVRFLDKYGGGFMVGHYDSGDDESRAVLKRAFALATKLGGVVVTKGTEVEVMDVLSKSTGEAFHLFHQVCQREKSKLLLGQTSSAEVQSSGLGSSIGDHQADVRDDFMQFDAKRLAASILHHICDPILQINGMAGRVTVSFGAEDTEDNEAMSRIVAGLFNAGIEVTEEGVEVIADRIAIPLRRIQAAQPPAGDPAGSLLELGARFTSPVDAANTRIAREASAQVSRTFGSARPVVARALAQSRSPEDFHGRLTALFPFIDAADLSAGAEAALLSMAANAIAAR